MDVTFFSKKFSAYDVEPQKFLHKRPSDLPGESKLTSLCSVEHLHYNWLVRRALYKWRKNERDKCLQEKLRMTYRPDAEKKMASNVYRSYPRQSVPEVDRKRPYNANKIQYQQSVPDVERKRPDNANNMHPRQSVPDVERKRPENANKMHRRQNVEIDLSSSVQVLPVRRYEDNKIKKPFSTQRKRILKVNSLQQAVKYRIRRLRRIKRRTGTAVVADLYDGNTVILPPSFNSLNEEEEKFLDSGNVYLSYNGRIGGMDILNFE